MILRSLSQGIEADGEETGWDGLCGDQGSCTIRGAGAGIASGEGGGGGGVERIEGGLYGSDFRKDLNLCWACAGIL